MTKLTAEQRDQEHCIHPYTNLKLHLEKGPVIISEGSGIYVYDQKGKEYIEGLAGLWCTSFGFGEEALISNAKRNATVVMTLPGDVMRLSKDAFDDYVKEPLITWVSPADAQK